MSKGKSIESSIQNDEVAAEVQDMVFSELPATIAEITLCKGHHIGCDKLVTAAQQPLTHVLNDLLSGVTMVSEYFLVDIGVDIFEFRR